jgi:nucleoside-diphosphate-sugar epimerase
MRVKDARQTFLGIWIRLLVEGKSFEVWGGEQLRDFNYVDDVVDALLLAATSEGSRGKIFNLGATPPISLKQAAELLIEAAGEGEYHIRQFPDERKRIDIGDYYSDYTFIHETIGWEPKIDLLEGFKRSIDYYRRELIHYL